MRRLHFGHVVPDPCVGEAALTGTRPHPYICLSTLDRHGPINRATSIVLCGWVVNAPPRHPVCAPPRVLPPWETFPLTVPSTHTQTNNSWSAGAQLQDMKAFLLQIISGPDARFLKGGLGVQLRSTRKKRRGGGPASHVKQRTSWAKGDPPIRTRYNIRDLFH